jgi:glucose-6-phosphate 1-epimerase
VELGGELRLTLEVENTGDRPFRFEEALHSYFTVGDVRQAWITGLEGTDFLDKPDGFARKRQGEVPVRVEAETDRVYLDTATTCEIVDESLRRVIAVGKTGSRSTVVWNPWRDRARALPDFGDDEWQEMVCVETANVGEAAIEVPPAGRHVMTAAVAVRPA